MQTLETKVLGRWCGLECRLMFPGPNFLFDAFVDGRESLLTIGFTSQTTLFFFVLFFRRTQPAKDKWLFCDPGRKQK